MKPQDLFIGVRDVLALLVPGAVLLLLLPIEATRLIAAEITVDAEVDATLLLFAFLIGSLAAGSLLSALAGRVDAFVDRHIEADLCRIRFILGREALCRHIGRMKRLRGLAAELQDATIARDHSVPGMRDAPWTTRGFWWTYLRLNCSQAISELDRIEGLQKQFRSLALVGTILAVSAVLHPLNWSVVQDPTKFPAFLSSLSNLLSFKPWLLSIAASLAACLCFAAYAVYRVAFSTRLFELALIRVIPADPLLGRKGLAGGEPDHSINKDR